MNLPFVSILCARNVLKVLTVFEREGVRNEFHQATFASNIDDFFIETIAFVIDQSLTGNIVFFFAFRLLKKSFTGKEETRRRRNLSRKFIEIHFQFYVLVSGVM